MSNAQPIETRLLEANPTGIAEAAALLRAGGLVAFPTETVYGLGADAGSGEAVAGIYAAKSRPSFNPLIAHVPDARAAAREGTFNVEASRLAEVFWPGPLTLVVPAGPSCGVSGLARAGLQSVALRVPSHPVARALIEAAGRPIVAPSANRSGRISPTCARHVVDELSGRVHAILDGGSSQVGLESTVISCIGAPHLLRAGGVTRDDIEAVLGHALNIPTGDIVMAPGMLASHYAPAALVRLEAAVALPHEAVLDYGGRLIGQGMSAYLDLSPARDLAEAAARLFDYLRRLDGLTPTIAVAPIPNAGLGEAINDRLIRAAAPRPPV